MNSEPNQTGSGVGEVECGSMGDKGNQQQFEIENLKLKIENCPPLPQSHTPTPLPHAHQRRPRSAARLLTLAALLVAAPALASSLAARLQEPYLSGLRRGAQPLRQGAVPTERSGEFLDVRCVLHAHSQLSHDSRGTEQQLIAAAKAAGVRAVFMTEHPTPDRKWQTEGLRGEKDGVLFIPGAELSDGLIVWRGEKANWAPGDKAGQVLESLKDSDGVAFVAHPEHRKTDADWDLPPYAGMEIYNSHADAADSEFEKVLPSLRADNPLKLLTMVSMLKKYQREAFAAIFDEQSEVLKRWDTLNERFLSSGRRVVGIAGNDSHQNVGMSVEAAEDGLIIKDALNKTVSTVPKKDLPLLLLGPLKPGAVLLSHTFDPYEVSMGYVNTHVLAPEVTEPALFDALLKGRAYVAFDWIANPSGFRYFAKTGDRTIEMGGDVKAADQPTLTVQTNLPSQIRLLRNGQEVKRTEGNELTFEVKEPGVYRSEAWVHVGEEERPWIYSNPVYALPAP